MWGEGRGGGGSSSSLSQLYYSVMLFRNILHTYTSTYVTFATFPGIELQQRQQNAEGKLLYKF